MATARSGHLLKELLHEHPKQLAVISGNIANAHIAYNILEAATENFGRVDGLIINQGTLEPVVKVADSRVEDWKTCFDVNFFGAISLVSLKSRLSCSLILLSSKQHCLRCDHLRETSSLPLQEQHDIHIQVGALTAPVKPH